MNEFYIGQIFEETYPTEAADWVDLNHAQIDEIDPIEVDGELVKRYQIVEETHTPITHEFIEKCRECAYQQEVDILHARKLRKTILGKWTEEDEAQYIQDVIDKSAEIEQRYPYPEE